MVMENLKERIEMFKKLDEIGDLLEESEKVADNISWSSRILIYEKLI